MMFCSVGFDVNEVFRGNTVDLDGIFGEDLMEDCITKIATLVYEFVVCSGYTFYFLLFLYEDIFNSVSLILIRGIQIRIYGVETINIA